MWVHGKYQSQMKTCIGKVWFLLLVIFVNHKNWWPSRKMKLKKWAFYGFSKYGKWLQICHLRNQIPLTVFAKSLAEEPCSLFLIFGLNYMYQAWLGAKKSKFCPVCGLCYSTMHLAFHSPGPQIISLHSHDWFFWTNPSIMGVWKVHYLWGILY